MAKVTIIGSGNVGATAAMFIAQKGLANVVLIDIIEGIAQGKALDIWEAMPLFGSNVKVIGSTSYQEAKDSDIVVITAGMPRRAGMSRDDLLNINKKIIISICQKIKKYTPSAVIIVVTNPVDTICYLALKSLGFPKQRVIGMAGVLDSTRYRAFIANTLRENVNNVKAMVLGTHGDLMVPLIKHTIVKGVPISEIFEKEEIRKLVERTRFAGGEIVNLLKKGSAYYAAGASILEIVEAILTENKKVLPCSVYLEGEYGINGIYIGVPCVLNKKGLQEIKEFKLTREERKEFHKSALKIKDMIRKL